MIGKLQVGVAVACVAAMTAAGADEVRDFFAKNVYGELPPKPAELRFELVERGEAFEGAAERRQYAVRVPARGRAGNKREGWSFEALVYLPKDAKGPVPAFVYPNFYGNHTLSSDLAVRRYEGFAIDGAKAGYGEKSARVPVEEIVARGYAFVTYCYSALYPDRTGKDAAAESVWSIFDPTALPDEKLAHPAWAWGGMRVRDLLATLPEIAQDKVAVAGQSRMGKNALVIGVNDPRFALVCANCGGTKWLRHLPNLKFPAWFSRRMGAWAQNGATGLGAAELERRAAKLPPPPFEQDAYLGLIAPRALMVSAASADRFAPAEESRAVYEAAKRRFDAVGGRIAWHLKEGQHSITAEDWAAFLDFADEVFGVTHPAYAPPTVDTSDDRVESPLKVDLKRLGTLKPRAADEIASSNWRLGCETLDRDFADFGAYRRYLGPLGIKTVRLQGGWAKCEKTKGVYDFAWLDRIVDFLVVHGMEPAIETDYGNSIYPGGGGCDLAGGFPSGDEALAAWDAWVDALTRHFADRVKVWMMWNEPDYSTGRKKTPEEIAAFNVRTAKIVKRNVPDAKIAGLSLAWSDPAFLERCLRPMGADAALFDWIVYHGYEAAPETSYANVEAMKAVVAKYAPRAKLWQGENGAPSEWATKFALSEIPWTEYSQAKWDLRRMLGDLGHDVASSVFTICDFNHLGREINRKGLLRADAWHRVTRVKRAYYAVQNVASLFDDRWTRDANYTCADPTLSSYRYVSKDGTPLVVFWTHRTTAGQKGFERPGDSFATREVPRTVLGVEAGDLVWIDLLTGRVHELPQDRATVPAYDSPCAALPYAGAAVACVAAMTAAGAAEPFTAATTDALMWLWADSAIKLSETIGEVDVPANGVADVNVLLNGLASGEPVRVSCAQGGELYRLQAVPVRRNSGKFGFIEMTAGTNPYVQRRAPFEVFDILRPIADGVIADPKAVEAVRWIGRGPWTVGTNRVTFTVRQGETVRTLGFRVIAHAAKLPPVGRGGFKYTNWFNFNQIAVRHRVKPWSEEHWALVGKYVEMAAAGRQNMSWFPTGFVLNPKEEPKFARLLSLYDKAGIWYLEGPHLASFNGPWGSPDFKVCGTTNVTTTAEGRRILEDRCRRIACLLDKYNLRERWRQHIADEPNEANAAEYRRTAAIVRAQLPGIRLTDAVGMTGFEDVIDIPCPTVDQYEKHREGFLRAKDEVWTYVCCVPGGRWMNRFMDVELLRPTLLPWASVHFGVKGFLHWGYNQWQPDQDPFLEPYPKTWAGSNNGRTLPPGDTHIVYPGTDGPWASARLEATRQGMEDAELLLQLKAKDEAAAERIIRRIVYTYWHFEAETPAYRQARRELLSALSSADISVPIGNNWH